MYFVPAATNVRGYGAQHGVRKPPHPSPQIGNITMARGIYISAMTPGSGKSLVTLGLADMLLRHADRVGADLAAAA